MTAAQHNYSFHGQTFHCHSLIHYIYGHFDIMTSPNVDAVYLKITRKRFLKIMIIITIIVIIIQRNFSPQKHFRSFQMHVIPVDFRCSVISMGTAFFEELKDCTGYDRNNSHILKGNTNQTKQGTQNILLLITRTYNSVF